MLEGLPEKLCRITGIGQSEVGRPSPKSAIELTIDAATMAIADAGLRIADIDGVVNYPPKTHEGGGISPVSVLEASYALGIDARWNGVANHGLAVAPHQRHGTIGEGLGQGVAEWIARHHRPGRCGIGLGAEPNPGSLVLTT